MDPSAYIDRETWIQILRDLQLDESHIRDSRYDAVIHLVSAAKGAESFYSLANNEARSEGLSLARELDDRVMDGWKGHPNLSLVDNVSCASFEEKCERVLDIVSGRICGLQPVGKRRRKWLVSELDWEAKWPVECCEFTVEHAFVNTHDGSQTRIRKRIGASSKVYSLTTRHPEVSGQRVETRRTLSMLEYETLKSQGDPTRQVITKKRRCFLYKDRNYQMDMYTGTASSGTVILEAYMDAKADLPHWMALQDVSDDMNYSMYELAKK